MRFELGISASIMRLYNGHRSVYLTAIFGRRRFWLMRWDVARAPRGRFLSRDGLMGWTAGIHRIGA